MVSKNVKPPFITYGKMHYGECITGTGSFYGFVKEVHIVRDCPNVAYRGNKAKQVKPSVPKDDAPTKRCFHAL